MTSPELSPNSYLDRDTLRPKYLVGMGFDYLLHSERGVAGPDCVVLKRERCSEERHDTVAHHLVDRAFVLVHSLHHPLENGVEKPAGPVGIQVGDVFRRSFQIGEKDRELLSFTLQCRLGKANLLGDMPRGTNRAPHYGRPRTWG